METLRAVWTILVALWNTGNRWVRWTISLIGFWPVVLIGVAITGIPILTSLLALLPVLAVVLLLLAIIDPLVLAVIGSFERGRSALRVFATIIGVELVIGVYFSTIPVWKDRGLIPLLVLVLAAIGFLAAGLQGKIAKRTISILILLAIILTIIFISGGREGSYQRWKSLTSSPPASATSVSPARPERVIEVTAPVGRWSDYVSIPPLHWFRIWPEAKIRVRTLRGREFELEPGRPVLLGDDITDATFQFAAAGKQTVAVKIALQSK